MLSGTVGQRKSMGREVIGYTRIARVGGRKGAGFISQEEQDGVPAGQFGFLPDGALLTYADVMRLPPEPRAIASTVRTHMSSDARGPGLLLRQYGFLLGRAPISGVVGAAILRAMAKLPGIRLCGTPEGLSPTFAWMKRTTATRSCSTSSVDCSSQSKTDSSLATRCSQQ